MEDTSLNETVAGETVVVSDPEAARVLTDLTELRFLIPFLMKLTLSEAAQALGLKLNTMHYRVKRLMRLGLLKVVREEPRKGRAVKVYRATSANYFVPFETTSAEPLDMLFAQLRARMNALFNRNIARSYLEVEGIGLRVRAQGHNLGVEFDTLDGGYLARDTAALDLPAALTNERVMRLEFSRAKALQRELEALLERYEDDGEAGQDYLLILGLDAAS